MKDGSVDPTLKDSVKTGYVGGIREGMINYGV